MATEGIRVLFDILQLFLQFSVCLVKEMSSEPFVPWGRYINSTVSIRCSFNFQVPNISLPFYCIIDHYTIRCNLNLQAGLFMELLV